MTYPPREGDLPVMQLVDQASKEILLDQKKGIKTDIYFKFTCEHCGARCTFDIPNCIWDQGECAECGKLTKVKFGGYLKASRMS